MVIKQKGPVPNSLRTWFVIHFFADILFAIPMFIIPVKFMQLLGWQNIDPVTTRMVAAALFGIGGESLLSRNASIDSFKTMLSLKIIWSSFAITGITIAIIQNLFNHPVTGFGLLIIFILFNILWSYWRIRLKQS